MSVSVKYPAHKFEKYDFLYVPLQLFQKNIKEWQITSVARTGCMGAVWEVCIAVPK